MNNPLESGRFVSDKTFAIRFLSYLCWLFPSDGSFVSCMDEEEYEYLCRVACNLIKYQVETCPQSEKWYFENLKKDYKDGKDIILNFVCSNNPEFAHFLKAIKAV